MTRITIIGGGNMATAMISGLLRSGTPPTSINVSDPEESKRSVLEKEYGIQTFESNISAMKFEEGLLAEVVILAVKPQVVVGIAKEVSVLCKGLVISIVRGYYFY